jgi:hypothetical protein
MLDLAKVFSQAGKVSTDVTQVLEDRVSGFVGQIGLSRQSLRS